MTFRIKHFKTNKILSLSEFDEKLEKLPFKAQGMMKGAGINDKKIYKFILIDNIIDNSIDEEKLLSKEYQYSLFGFKKTNKSKSVDSTKPSINDFLKLYHVKTNCYIKIITGDSKKKNILNFDDMLKCYLTLIKYPDEKEVVRIERLHYNTQWKFKFIQNLYYLTCYIIQNIEQELGEMKNRDLYLNDNISNNENLQKIKNEYLDEFSGEENFEVSIEILKDYIKKRFITFTNLINNAVLSYK